MRNLSAGQHCLEDWVVPREITSRPFIYIGARGFLLGFRCQVTGLVSSFYGKLTFLFEGMDVF